MYTNKPLLRKSRANPNLHIVGRYNRYDIDSLGGKALSLIRLDCLNFNIPRGLVLSTIIFDEVIASNELSSSFTLNYEQYTDFIKTMKESMLSSKIPYKTVAEINGALSKYALDKKFLIVRSSATIEDGFRYSFAGQFDT